MQIGVLGALQVVRDDVHVDLGAPKQRILLAGLAMTPNQPVSVDALAQLIWRDDPPAAVAASLHGYVAALRRALEPARAARDRPDVLLTMSPGYELRVPDGDIDSFRFGRSIESVHQHLSGADVLTVPERLSDVEMAQLVAELDLALALWRGDPFPELEGDAAATAERVRLEDLRLLAIQDRARLQLALGEHGAVAADLATTTRLYPLREDLWGLRSLALARGGRQAEALEALRTARVTLSDELGIDPGPRLRELEIAILQQDVSVHGRPRPEALRARATVSMYEGVHSELPAPRGGVDTARVGPPLVGRDDQLGALEEIAGRARSGVPQVAMLIGEPGIGKTRLARELASREAERGFTVLLGRCSQDEGAPPLWPWSGVLRTLSSSFPEADIPELGTTDPTASTADRFRTFDQVARLFDGLCADNPLLLVFDDLHWADASSLRLLRHLIDTVDHGRLLVVATRRSHPEPHGPLADFAEALARRDALRLELHGLTQLDAVALARATAGAAHDTQHVGRLRDRTDGNPFFLLELLRLGGDRLQELEQGVVPPAVGDVIAARFGQLPPATQDVLRSAAVVGRSIDLHLLSRLEGAGAAQVLDRLEPAMAAGTVVEAEDGGVHFSHALVRDAIYAGIPRVRRQRLHARVAQELADSDPPGHRLAEIAQHWLRAGPTGTAQGWAAAAAAAHFATNLQAYEEAADLLQAALESQHHDPTATPEQRYDLLMARASACRAAANGDGQREATGEAIRIAESLNDVDRLALAAVTSSEGALWSNRPQGVVHEATVEALHRSARELPVGDSALRCRVFLALSRELFFAPHPQECEANAERGLAMARRLNDPQLHAWACHTTIVSILRPATLEVRSSLADEAIACSRAAHDEEGEATGLFWRAIAAGEAGRLDDRRTATRSALDIADRHRLRYLQVMLSSYEVPWLALEGRSGEAEELYAQTLRWGAHASFPFRDETLAAVRLCLDLWQGHAADLLPSLMALDSVGPVDLSLPILLVLLRSDHIEGAAHHLERRPLPLAEDTFETPLRLALGAEAGLVVDRADLAAEAYTRLAPLAGRCVVSGAGIPLGPTDCFLALAASAVSEEGLATEHADQAVEMCRNWGLTEVTRWFEGLRAGHGF